MNKILRDKIITVLGTGLLGYYLGLSLFRGLIWSSLLKVLPPINDRHLPDIYLGITGAVVTGILAYLIFNLFVEKRSFKVYKKSYLVAISLLVIAPLIIAGIFRVHAVTLVAKAEDTTPTVVTIRSDNEENSLMFATGENSAGGVEKAIYVSDETFLREFGQGIRQLELKEVVEREKQFDTPYLTMWINYSVDGRWYSKIMRYNQGMFSESVAGQRMAYYTNPELEKLIEKLLTNSKDINNYDRARVINSLTINGEVGPKDLLTKEFQVLVSSLRGENLIEEDTEGVIRIKKALEEWVPQGEVNIYGIELMQKGSVNSMGRNFMVYDKLNQTLMFEGRYYQVDLDDMITEK